MKLLKLVALLLLGLIIIAPAAIADQKNSGLQISPLRSRPALNPGETTAGSMTIKNDTDKPMSVTLSVEKFSVVDEAYNYDFKPGENTNWVRITDSAVVLASQESKKIAYSLAVPNDAPPGGHYFAILASSENSSNNTTLKEVKRVASLIYLGVNGSVVKNVNVIGLDIPWFSTTTTINTDIRLNNKGNSHYPARLKLYSQNIIDQKSQSTQTEGLILPGTIRKLSTQYRLPSIPGIYRINVGFSPPQGGLPQSNSQIVFYFPAWAWVVAFLVGLWIIRKIFVLKKLQYSLKKVDKKK